MCCAAFYLWFPLWTASQSGSCATMFEITRASLETVAATYWPYRSVRAAPSRKWRVRSTQSDEGELASMSDRLSGDEGCVWTYLGMQ